MAVIASQARDRVNLEQVAERTDLFLILEQERFYISLWFVSKTCKLKYINQKSTKNISRFWRTKHNRTFSMNRWMENKHSS